MILSTMYRNKFDKLELLSINISTGSLTKIDIESEKSNYMVRNGHKNDRTLKKY